MVSIYDYDNLHKLNDGKMLISFSTDDFSITVSSILKCFHKLNLPHPRRIKDPAIVCLLLEWCFIISIDKCQD